MQTQVPLVPSEAQAAFAVSDDTQDKGQNPGSGFYDQMISKLLLVQEI